MSDYHINYYKAHRNEIRMKAYINRANKKGKDTERKWYLRKAKDLLPLVKIEKAEHKRLEALKLKKVAKVLSPAKKKPLTKKNVKYKVIDDDSFILDFN